MKGRPEPEVPDFDPTITDVHKWAEEIFKEWDQINQLIGELRESPDLNAKTSKKIMAQAKLRKAESDRKVASSKADIATMVENVAREYKTGDIYISIPELDLKTRIKWNE